jgi:DNA polymerase-1
VEELTLIKCIKELMANPKIKFVAQNAQYDMTYLLDKWGVRCKLWMDTMIAFHCVYPEMRKSLAFLTSIYSKRPYYKDDGGQGNTPEQEWIYNCKDTCVTYEVAIEIRKEMEEFGTLSFYEEHANQLIEPLMQMQRRGILIDLVKRERLDKELTLKIEELQTRLNKAVGKELNVNSPKQIKELLYEDLGLPPIYGWGKKAGQKAKVLSADEDAIEQLQKKTSNPVLGIILEIRGLVKLLGTYVKAELESNSRICCSYKITGTETGRLSSTKSIYGRGTNLQNIPREPSIRSMFIADPGYLLVNADLSQAEARIVAYIAQEERMIRVFETGEDIHTYNASIIFNKHPRDILPSERQTAKNRVHGANYGIGPAKAAKLAGTTEAKALEDLNKYKARFPMLEVWWRSVEEQIARSRVMSNYFGRRRMFFGRWGADLIREAIAYYPQSTVGDLLNLGIIRSFPALPQGWELLANNHDAVLAQVPEETDDMHIYKWFKHYYEIPLEIFGRRFTIPIDLKKGKSWGEMKKLEV